MKTALISGILNDKSIAYAIGQELNALEYRLIITYQSESIRNKVQQVTKAFNNVELIKLDVTNDNDFQNLVTFFNKNNIKLNALLHAIAFSNRNELVKDFFSITQENFLQSMNISCYSFIHLAKILKPYLEQNASLLTITYGGSQRVIPHYNVMGIAKAALESSVKYLAEALGKDGIRVNGLSAGPIRTVSAFGISDFDYILNVNRASAPLRRNITLKDIAGSGKYLLTEQSSGVTGEIHYVDCGYHILGMENPYCNREWAKR